MSLTNGQKEAIRARGNVLVVAGAGTGKTTTLVERCLDCLLSEVPPVSLDEILMVTFTEAAAAEMRQRIRSRLIEEAERNPGQGHWPEQLALFETAQIGTLHSFCLQLVRQHFYELELDPQVAVLPQEEARLQANEVLEDLLQKHYAGKSEAAAGVQELIQSHGRGWDEPIRRLVLRLHHYSQTLPDPGRWIENQSAGFAAPEPTLWQGWREQAIADWSVEQLPSINRLAATNPIAARCAPWLEQLQSSSSEAGQTPLLKSIMDTADECPSGKKGAWLDPLENFFIDAGFLLSICPGATDPLQEDWTWVRSQMSTILGLTREFTQAFTEAKRELGVLDFHDLEQYALRLLWDSERNEPTPIAQEWRRQLRFLFIDEYQDINAAQDQILQALGREGNGANRFLVGDIKQSIYRFRLANPYIFRRYMESWGNGQGTVIPLVDNFRSREALLDFINDFFGAMMCPELGGVAYDEATRLRFGAPAERESLSAGACATPSVELLLREKKTIDSSHGEDSGAEVPSELAELEEAQKEARLLGLRLLELKLKNHPVWDAVLKDFRSAQWRDMAVLLRAPANKAESYAKEFARLNIPLEVARRGFYQSVEISDLVSLLQILDNPLQDIPILAVLHSPLVGLTLNELAEIRLTLPKGHFWNALTCWIESQRTPAAPLASAEKAQSTKRGAKASKLNGPGVASQEPNNPQQLLPLSEQRASVSFPPLCGKLTGFLERYDRWRRVVRQVSLSRCLESILAETHYGEWLLTQDQGEQRYANVQRLIGLAERFNQFQRQGLFRFLRFIAGQQAADTEPEVRAVSEEDAVRLMSIHQSKGLEFPIVVLADLAKPFNRADVRADIILDESYGICPQIKPPHTGSRYPSLPYWLARRRQTQELLGEELRLLYVGMTRARDTLILSAGVAGSRLEKAWATRQPLTPELLRGAQSYADWLACWFALNSNDPEDLLTKREGQVGRLRWTRHDDASLVGKLNEEPAPTVGREPIAAEADAQTWERLQQHVAWRYPWIAATSQPAKTSVSALRRRANMEQAESAPARWAGADRQDPANLALGKSKNVELRLSAAEIGDAHHTFLQFVNLEKAATVAALEQEAARQQTEGILTASEVAALDFEALAGFWYCQLGKEIRSRAAFVRRELAFTARFCPNELAPFSGEALDPRLEHEYVVVQGIADLVVLLPKEIWLVDFKTDGIKPDEIASKAKFYQPQLWVYAQALARTFDRPVSQSWLYFLAPRRAVRLESVGG